MFIEDTSIVKKRFYEIGAGVIFRRNGTYWLKLLEMVYTEKMPEYIRDYNVVNLNNGEVAYMEDMIAVETLGGHTLKLSDEKEENSN